MSEKDMFIKTREAELPITLRVLRAYPADKLDWRPHEKSKTAAELVTTFIMEEQIVKMNVTTGVIDFAKMEMPNETTLEDMVNRYEQDFKANNELVKNLSDQAWQEQISWGGRPMARSQALWIPVMDAVHHRGQMSVYIRMAGGLVPSIYGPSADDNGGM